MRITLKDHYANNWRNWRNYPRPIDQQQKNKLAKSLIENGHIQVRFKKNTNPATKIHPNNWTTRINPYLKYDYSLLNVYLFHFPQWKKPLHQYDNITIRPPRRTSTYKHKLFLKKNYNEDSHTLDFLVFKAGWANSIKNARHLIRQAQITVNNISIFNHKFEPKKASIIKNLNPNSIFHYYKQKYHATFRYRKFYRPKKFKSHRHRLIFKLRMQFTRYPFAIQPNYMTKINFNKVYYD